MKKTDQVSPTAQQAGPTVVRMGSASPFKEIGQYGLQRSGGYITEDFVTALHGQRGARKYREMLDNCAVVSAAMTAITMLIRKVDWDVEPFSEDTEDTERAERIQEMINDMSVSWEHVLSEVLNCIPYGSAPMEIVYKKREGAKKLPGDSSRYNDGLIGWRKLALRGLETVLRWEFDDETGNVTALVQNPPPNFPIITIPVERLLLFQIECDKGNPEGRSLLRGAYFDWIILKRLIELSAIGIERDVNGIPVIKAPANVVNGTDATALANTKAIGENLRMDEQACVVLASEVDQDTKAPLWSMELLQSAGAKQYDIDAFIQRHEQRILMVIGLSDWITIGHEGTGSRALVDPKIDMSAQMLDGIMDNIAEVFTRHAFPRLFALNGWPLDRMPKMTHGSANKEDITAAMALLDGLAKAGADVFPDEKLMRYFMQMGKWPTEGRDDMLVDDSQTGTPVRPKTLPVDTEGNPIEPQEDPEHPAFMDERQAAREKESEDDPKKPPTRKSKAQPRNRGGKWAPSSADTVNALKLLQERQRVGSGDSIATGLRTADEVPFDRKKDYKEEIDSAKVETVKISDLIGTQPTVRRSTVEAMMSNPYLIRTGKRNLSGTLEDLPVVVRFEGKNYLQDGHHRVTAKRMVGHSEVIARVIEI
jgi:hypothetical protein